MLRNYNFNVKTSQLYQNEATYIIFFLASACSEFETINKTRITAMSVTRDIYRQLKYKNELIFFKNLLVISISMETFKCLPLL
jgi:hypothetical protein